MAGFASTDSYRRFESAVKRETRYIYNSEVRDFLAAVVETSQKRKDSIEKSTILWRAQRGYTWRLENPGTEEEFEMPDAFDPARMVPKTEFVGDGRVNPRGIPCLYFGIHAGSCGGGGSALGRVVHIPGAVQGYAGRGDRGLH